MEERDEGGLEGRANQDVSFSPPLVSSIFPLSLSSSIQVPAQRRDYLDYCDSLSKIIIDF